MAESQLEDLKSRLETLEESVEADIQDLRDRVVQVKRETDSKAPADHTHEQLEQRLDQQLEQLQDDLEDTQADLSATNARLEGGFENFEEILESLMNRTETLETDVETLGTALQTMRRTLDSIGEREQQRARADHLKRTAAKRGVRTAKCADCNSKLDVALLSTATCPNCEARFHTLDANPGFFGTSILETGERPALEGGSAASRPDLESMGGTEAGEPSADLSADGTGPEGDRE